MSEIQDGQRAFEDDVRRVARALWPAASSGNPEMLLGRERDGVFESIESIHVIEASVSRKKDKTKFDLEKSVELIKDLRAHSPQKFCKIWLVLPYDPTAEQQELVKLFRKKAKCLIEILSFRTFSSKIANSSYYLSLRDNYAFGSVRNPQNDRDIQINDAEYIPLDLVDIKTKEKFNAAQLPDLIDGNSGIITLVGDYGAGKSTTMRSAYFALKQNHLRGETQKFPIYINLRDHFGQDDPAEALLRHGNKIGMQDPSALIAAWRAGFAHVFLDGFDELSSSRLVRGANRLRQARKEAMRLVRAFVDQMPGKCSLFVSGRQHYFDSHDELVSALGLTPEDRVFTLNEFSQEQVIAYLRAKGIADTVPDWLPSRPLLLGYLVVSGIMGKGGQSLFDLTREEGWDSILRQVCEREAKQIDPIAIDPTAVREFIERLATRARSTTSGRGPIENRDIDEIYQQVFDMRPDEKAETLIFRLPGFTAAPTQENAREFIDGDFVDACRAGDVIRFVENPYEDVSKDLFDVSIQVGQLGIGIASFKLQRSTPKQVSQALSVAAEKLSASILGIDLIKIMQNLNFDYVNDKINIRDAFVSEFEIVGSVDLAKIELVECYFGLVDVDIGGGELKGPWLLGCHISEISGVISRNEIPDLITANGSEWDKITDDATTNADILSLTVPLSVRVLMTVLRKLFVQSGAGRKENSFYRGLDQRGRSYVSDVLEMVATQEFARPYRLNGPRVWIPNRAHAKEAHEILRAPQSTRHPLLDRVRAL
jgi:hypothetical protein